MVRLNPKAVVLGGAGSGCGHPPGRRSAPGWVNVWLRGLCVVLLCLVGGRPAVAAPTAEYQIKAAYLLNFARYVEWPAARVAAGQPGRACVLGRDPFGGALVGLEGRQVNGREVRVRQLDGADQAGDCHVVFIADSEERRVPGLLRLL